MKSILNSLVLLFLFSSTAFTQLVTSEPLFPLTNEPVKIIFDASLGNAGLAGHNGDVYAHTGVITEESQSFSDWKYVKTDWGQNTVETKLTRIGTDLYELNIDTDIRSFYGVPANETILQIALVFRSGAQVGGSYLEGKTATNGDIFIEVYETAPGFQSILIAPTSRNILVDPGENIDIQIEYSQQCAISVFDNGNLIDQVTDTRSYSNVITPVDDLGHVLELIAVAGTDSIKLTLAYLRSREPDIVALPPDVKPGLNKTNDNEVILVLDAPDKSRALIHTNLDDYRFSHDRWMNQTPDKRYFWKSLDISSLNGDPLLYTYIVDEGIVIADPMAHNVLDKRNDPFIDESLFPNLPDFPELVGGELLTFWDESDYSFNVPSFPKPAKRDLVIYEILIRDFLGSHSYQDLIDTVSYLKSLGVNAVELMPINEFEGNISWGYNPSFHGAVDKFYGHPDKLKEFIDVCHENGIAVILDVVFNHVFSQSPLAQLYWDRQQLSPTPDNPWLNVVAKHPFNVGYDVNHEYSGTKEWMDALLERWLVEFKFDGFRFDLSKGFTQFDSGNNIGLWGQYDATRIALLKRVADVIWNIDPTAFVVLEHFADNDEEKELSDYGMMIWGNMTHQYGEASLGFTDNDASDISWAYYKNRGWNDAHVIAYMESHDEERMMYKNLNFGNSAGDYDITDQKTALQRVALASTFFYTIPGPKMLWQFGEMGYPFSINYCTNGTVNDNCRLDPKPIRWDYLDDIARKELNTIVSDLIHLKISQSDLWHNSSFNFDLVDEVKSMKFSSPELNAIVLGNFDVTQNNEFVLFQKTGWWYEFFTGDSIQITNVAQTIELQPGEYLIYFDKPIKPNSIDPISSTNENTTSASPFILYPNPVQEEVFQIKGNTSDIEKVTIVNAMGQQVFSTTVQNQSGTLRIKLPQQVSVGTYFVNIQTTTGLTSLPLIHLKN